MIAAGSGGLPPKKGERRMHSTLVRTFAEDRINEFRRDASIARMAKVGRDRGRAAKQFRASGGALWLRRMGTAFGASVVLALLAPAAFAIPVESDRDTVGTGTLAQLGNPTNIASGASQGYLSKVGRESRDTAGTGTLAQLGNPANIASGASQGYLSKVGRESPREPAVPIEGSTPEPWLWAGALVALITGAGTVAVWMHRHRRSVATA
jgi:hypothetical protein